MESRWTANRRRLEAIERVAREISKAMPSEPLDEAYWLGSQTLIELRSALGQRPCGCSVESHNRADCAEKE